MSEDLGSSDSNETFSVAATGQRRSDWSEYGSPSTAVVELVASLRGVSSVELPTLNEFIDPDALDRLLDGDRVGSVEITFEYDGTEIYVDSSGSVEAIAEG